MADSRLLTFFAVALCLAVSSATSEKQIKLEDIEKDNLKAAHQAKIEKELQEQQQQQQQQQHQTLQFQYQQPTYQYGAQQAISYQTPHSYFQYILPQQYVPQAHSQYLQLTADQMSLNGKSLGVGYSSPSHQTYQTYLSPHIPSVSSLSGFSSGQSLDTLGQAQPFIMALAGPLGGLQQNQHQQYYQSALHYYPSQSQQVAQFYYTPQVVDHSASLQYGSAASAGSAAATTTSSAAYPAFQQYVAYQPATSSKGATSFSSFSNSASQSFPSHSYSTQHGLSSLYSPQTYTTSNVYTNTETPIFVTVKAPKHMVASSGQKQQFSQIHTTTLSPLQTKYLNSPQYLAQNYNTIQSSQLYSKGSLSSGVKSTVAPPLKPSVLGAVSSATSGSTSSGHSYVSGSYAPFSSNPISFPTPSFKSLPVRSHSV